MKTTIQCLLLLFPLITFGQNKTYLGVEVGPKLEIYQHVGNGSALHTPPFFASPIYGLTLGQELNHTFIAETGFYINHYAQSYRIRGNSGYHSTTAHVAYQIPLRLKARLDLVKDRLSIVTTVGYTIALNNNRSLSGSGGSFQVTAQPEYNDSTRARHATAYSSRKIYGLIETGFALDYRTKKAMTFYLAGNYAAGFVKLVEMDVQYWINDGPEQTATVFSNGSYYSIVFGMKYPISNFWTNKQDS